jgi:hypothetical protein
MGGSCSMYVRDAYSVQMENPERRDHLGDLEDFSKWLSACLYSYM